MKVLSAQYQRNGVGGRGFFAAIVQDPFVARGGARTTGRFLVVSLDKPIYNPDAVEEPSPDETFVISMDNLIAGSLDDKWRGDTVDPAVLRKMRQVAG